MQVHPFHPTRFPDASWGQAWPCAAWEGRRAGPHLQDASHSPAPGHTALWGLTEGPRGQLQSSPLLTVGQLQGVEGQQAILWGWLGAHRGVQGEATPAGHFGTRLAVGVTLEREAWQDNVSFGGSQK